MLFAEEMAFNRKMARGVCYYFLALAIGVMMMGCIRTSKSVNLVRSMPETANGWQRRVPDGIYTAETLYKYIDGAAELYRAFNVKKIVSRYYVKEKEPDIIVDIFDMGTSYDAFGVYHHAVREGAEAGIGQDSEFIGANLYFWKGSFYVSIIGLGETEELKRTIEMLGRSIADGITEEGARPDLIELLPAGVVGLREVNYFHNSHCLNTYYYLADENLFNLDQEAEGVLGRYHEGKPSTEQGEVTAFVVLVIRYDSKKEAGEALRNFLAKYLPDADAQGITRTEDGAWTGAESVGNHVIGVFDAATEETARSLLEETSARIISRRNDREEER
jgi:hypothetical protein